MWQESTEPPQVKALNGDQLSELIKLHQVETGEQELIITLGYSGLEEKLNVGYDGRMLCVAGSYIEPWYITEILVVMPPDGTHQ